MKRGVTPSFVFASTSAPSDRNPAVLSGEPQCGAPVFGFLFDPRAVSAKDFNDIQVAALGGEKQRSEAVVQSLGVHIGPFGHHRFQDPDVSIEGCNSQR